MKKISNLLKPLTQKMIQGERYYSAALMLDWEKIVGEKLFSLTQPEKIIFGKSTYANHTPTGILSLHVRHSAVAMELTFQEEVIREKINGYFGKKIIQKIKFKHSGTVLQNSVSKKNPSNHVRPPSPISPEILTLVDQIADQGLQQALLSLAGYIPIQK